MSNRHLSRTIAMQTLYQWDFNGQSNERSILTKLLDYNLAEFAPGFNDEGFADHLVDGVLEKW